MDGCFCTLLYCSLINHRLVTQVKKLRSLERRSKLLISNFDPNIIDLLKKRVCFFQYDVVNEKICPPLNDFYELNVSKINTRNNGCMVKLPKTKFEYGRTSLKFIGARISCLWKLGNNVSMKVLSQV